MGQEHFMNFLKKIRQVHNDRKIYLLVDNLSVHRTKNVKAKADELDIELIFNPIYSSEYNPIERLWLLSKRTFSAACINGASYHN